MLSLLLTRLRRPEKQDAPETLPKDTEDGLPVHQIWSLYEDKMLASYEDKAW